MEVEYKVKWNPSRGFYAHAHCPFCDSSLSSDGKWKRKSDEAIKLAVKNLIKHMKTVHNVG